MVTDIDQREDPSEPPGRGLTLEEAQAADRALARAAGVVVSANVIATAIGTASRAPRRS